MGFAGLLWSVRLGQDPNSESPRIQNYLRAKGVADGALRASGLDYVILAPGTLSGDNQAPGGSRRLRNWVIMDTCPGRIWRTVLSSLCAIIIVLEKRWKLFREVKK